MEHPDPIEEPTSPKRESDTRENAALSSVLVDLENGLGENPSFDLHRFIKQHPDYANEIREFADDRGVVVNVFPGGEEFQSGTRLGNYEILRRLDEGGMGVVYLARQDEPSRQVALKMISFEVNDERRRRLFLQEIEVVGRLDHPGIVPVFEAGSSRLRPFYAMPFIDGQNLQSIIDNEGPLSPQKCQQVVLLLAEAVRHAHGRDIVHRDIKPKNIMVTPAGIEKLAESTGSADRLSSGEVRLLDFGLSGLRNSENEVPGGTPGYMAPEQKTGSAEEGVDVFGLGATAYFLLTGQPPEFQKQNTGERLVWPGDRKPKNRDLVAVCEKCLEIEPSNRYVNVAELMEDLQRLMAGTPVAAREISMIGHVHSWVMRNRVLAFLLCVIMSLVVFFSGYLYWQNLQLNQAVLIGEQIMHGVQTQRINSFNDTLAEVLSSEFRIRDTRRDAAKLTMLSLANLNSVRELALENHGRELTLLQKPLAASMVQLAKSRLDEAIRIEPDYGPAYLLRGTIRFEIFKEPAREVIEDFQKAVELNPQTSLSFSGRGWCYKAMENWREAEADFLKAIALDPQNQLAHYGLAQLLDQNDRTPFVAAKHFELAAENHLRYQLFPNWIEAVKIDICLGLWKASNVAYASEDMEAAFNYCTKAVAFASESEIDQLLENLILIAQKSPETNHEDMTGRLKDLLPKCTLLKAKAGVQCVAQLLNAESNPDFDAPSSGMLSEKFRERRRDWQSQLKESRRASSTQ